MEGYKYYYQGRTIALRKLIRDYKDSDDDMIKTKLNDELYGLSFSEWRYKNLDDSIHVSPVLYLKNGLVIHVLIDAIRMEIGTYDYQDGLYEMSEDTQIFGYVRTSILLCKLEK